MKPLFDPSLYLVTYPSPDLLERVEKAIEGGVTLVQLRDKMASEAETIQLIRKLHPILQKKNIPLLLNDYVDLARAPEVAGVHLGSEDMSPLTARKILGPDKIIGLSISSASELENAPADHVDYFAASPVFPTPTKPDAAPALMLSGLIKLRQMTSKPLVAIGGINSANINDVLNAGVDGVSVISAILGSTDPYRASVNLSHRIREFRKPKRLLTIAGSDSGGGAGVQADLKTFAAHGTYGMSAITALTSQNTLGVDGIFPVPADFVKSQCEAIFKDIGVDAVKIGMVFNREIILTIANVLEEFHPRWVVLDPVMIAKGGDKLLSEEAMSDLREKLLPLSSLITPNIPEAEVLSGMTIENESKMLDAAKMLQKYCPAVLIKGGHGEGKIANDLLVTKESEEWFSFPRLKSKNTHGTGCTYAAAIASQLALKNDLRSAVSTARTYLQGAIAASRFQEIGRGHGPLNHGYGVWRGCEEGTT